MNEDERWPHLQDIQAAIKRSVLEGKMRAAYEHGRRDYRAGAICKPTIPMSWCDGLSELQRKFIELSWVDGWHNESQMAA